MRLPDELNLKQFGSRPQSQARSRAATLAAGSDWISSANARASLAVGRGNGSSAIQRHRRGDATHPPSVTCLIVDRSSSGYIGGCWREPSRYPSVPSNLGQVTRMRDGNQTPSVRGKNGRLVQLTQIDRGRARARYRRRFSTVLVGVVVGLLSVGCGSSSPSATTTRPALVATATPTAVPTPTSTPDYRVTAAAAYLAAADAINSATTPSTKRTPARHSRRSRRPSAIGRGP